MYGWHMQSWGAGGWLLMALMMLLFWGVVVFGIIALVRYLASPGDRGTKGEPENPRQVLDLRLARGEIDEAQYSRLLDVLNKEPQ